MASVPKFPNNEKVKCVNKFHKEATDEIAGMKALGFKYYMNLLKNKAEELKNSTNIFQSKFNSLKKVMDEIAEAKEINLKREQALRESTEINNRLKDKHDFETKKAKEFYKQRQIKYNQYFDERKAELE